MVHFDRLKLLDPGMRFNNTSLVSSSSPPPAPTGPELFGQDMEPCDTDNSELPPLSLAAPSHADVPHPLHLDILLGFVPILIDTETVTH